MPEGTELRESESGASDIEYDATERLAGPITGSGEGEPDTERLGSVDEARLRHDMNQFLQGSRVSLGDVVGDYEITGVLGSGGMGTVYAGRHRIVGKEVAIKVIRRELSEDPVAVRRFVHEARAVNAIGSPHIVDVSSFGVLDDGRSYMVMERLEGTSLVERMKTGKPLAVNEIVEIIEQVAVAIGAAHESGIVHRDLKPDNIFLARDPRGELLVKVLDFGIAKLQREEFESQALTATGVFMGTPIYVSPEQACGRSIDGGADVYSLCVIAYELLTGSPPFEAASAMELISMHLHTPPPSLLDRAPEIPSALAALIAAGLSKEPSNRPSVAEIRQQLASIRLEFPPSLAEEPAPQTPVSTPVAPGRRLAEPKGAARRRRLWLAGCAVLVVGIGTAVVLNLKTSVHPHESQVVESPIAGPSAKTKAEQRAAPAATVDERSSSSGGKTGSDEIDGAPEADTNLETETRTADTPQTVTTDATVGAKEPKVGGSDAEVSRRRSGRRHRGAKATRTEPAAKPIAKPSAASDLLDDPFSLGK